MVTGPYFTGMFFGRYPSQYTGYKYLVYLRLKVWNTLYFAFHVALNNTRLLELPTACQYLVTIHQRYAF